jgi:hypothetical protein
MEVPASTARQAFPIVLDLRQRRATVLRLAITLNRGFKMIKRAVAPAVAIGVLLGAIGVSSTALAGFSPAGCVLSAQYSHASNTVNFYHTVNHKVNLNCSYAVSRTVEVWGDRSSWSGWRLHASHKTSSDTYRTSAYNSGATGLNGYYDYRGRAKAWSYEGGITYSSEVWGTSRRVHCWTNGDGVTMIDCEDV